MTKDILEEIDEEQSNALSLTSEQWQSLKNNPKFKESSRLIDENQPARTLISSYKKSGINIYSQFVP